MNWVLFLTVLTLIECPKTPEQARKAIEREGAYGPLQIRQICLNAVNSHYETDITLQECLNSTVARWVCIHYIKMCGADTGFETAARTWNGGPKGPKRPSTDLHWNRFKLARETLR